VRKNRRWYRQYLAGRSFPQLVYQGDHLLPVAEIRPEPVVAQQIISENKADMVGLARALISDPEFLNKMAAGRADEIRACIGCNQACVGHRLAHFPVSCIQNPLSGRELQMGELRRTSKPSSVLVIGGGPVGMKAAVVAAQRGHRVQLHEKTSCFGGQVNLAQALPGRAEFGGVSTNLQGELKRADVDIQLNSYLDADAVKAINPDKVIVAIGAVSRLPEVDVEGVDWIDAWSIIRDDATAGKNVVIADWSCDWCALGVAEKLARDGHYVRLMSNGSVAGESIQSIVRDQWIGVLHGLRVEMTAYARFFGGLDGQAYFQHMTGGNAIICDDVDSIVSCYAARSNREFDWLEDMGNLEVVKIGDAIAPRTVEEAVLEGLQVSWAL